MGLKIVIPIGYQRVKRISLTAMPPRGAKNKKSPPWGDLGGKRHMGIKEANMQQLSKLPVFIS